MRVISEGANKCKKEKLSVCTVCTLRGLRFGVFERDMYCKSNWQNKIDADK